MMTFTGWFGFWMFMTVYICIEGCMYMHGHDTYFWTHKTGVEQELQLEQLRTKQIELLLKAREHE